MGGAAPVARQVWPATREEASDGLVRFLRLIFAATLIPFVGMPFFTRFHSDALSVVWITGWLHFFGGPGHVSLTAWFYTERDARSYFLENPGRYVVAPALLIVASMAILAVFPTGPVAKSFIVLYWIWQVYHYQRQNWGILSLISRATTGERASHVEEWVLRLAVAAGILASFRAVDLGTGTWLQSYASELFLAALVVYCAVSVLVCVALVSQPKLRRSPARLSFFLLSAAFFVPPLLFREAPSAFFPYALAHGLQYYVFMGYVAAGRGQIAVAPPSTSGVVSLVVWCIGLGTVIALLGDIGLTAHALPLFGLGMGLTMAHFVIDAGIWRFRDPFPRAYIGPAFDFLSRRL
jgi:hypothetical protein